MNPLVDPISVFVGWSARHLQDFVHLLRHRILHFKWMPLGFQVIVRDTVTKFGGVDGQGI